MAIAWVKQAGHAPSTLHRTDSGVDTAFWASAILWDLAGEEAGWHRNWRLLLDGLRASSAANGAPVGGMETISAAHRLMNARKPGLALDGAVEMVT